MSVAELGVHVPRAPYLRELPPQAARDLVSRAQSGDAQALELTHFSLSNLVLSEMKALGVQREYRDDAYQQGMLGALEAIQRYDPERGAALSTYAGFWVRAALYDFFEQIPLVRMGHEQRRERAQIIAYREQFRQDYRRDPSLEDIAKHLELGNGAVQAEPALRGTLSLDATLRGGDASLGNLLAASDSDPSKGLDREHLADVVRSYVHVLKPNEYQAIHAVYLSETPLRAKHLSSRQQSLLNRGLKRLRAAMREDRRVQAHLPEAA